MTDLVRVFICYKKELSTQRGDVIMVQKNTTAEILQYLLSQSASFEAWLDTAKLAAGMKWETEIYSQLLASDVLIALIGAGTSSSPWVQREIALANALGVSVVPIGFDLTESHMIEETRALSINDLQWMITRNIQLSTGPALLAEIEAPLKMAARATRDRQGQILAPLRKRLDPKPKMKAPDNQRTASFKMNDIGDVTLHITSGNIAAVTYIDALVNSENDYMQMARFFESHTVSSILRRRGASVVNGRYTDTIQQELDWQLRERGRPVQASEVFATSAGGPGSQLVKINKARVIIHVAAVQAVDAESRVVPYKHPYQIENCVRGILSVIDEINKLDGIFSPLNSPQRIMQEQLATRDAGRIKSVIFPLLGTGEGGAETSQVVEPMIDGMVGFLSDPDNDDLAHTLQDVYISAYTLDDLEQVRSALRSRFMEL